MAKPTAQRPRDINTALLPPQMRMLVRVMGLGPALRLLEARGGTRMTVPGRCSAEHWLHDVVGPQAFAALVADSANVTMDLPKLDAVTRQWRHQQVHELARYLSHGEVARRTGYTRRHVINICNAEAAAAGWAQLDLFAAPAAVTAAHTQHDSAAAAHDPFGLAGASECRDGLTAKPDPV